LRSTDEQARIGAHIDYHLARVNLGDHVAWKAPSAQREGRNASRRRDRRRRAEHRERNPKIPPNVSAADAEMLCIIADMAPELLKQKNEVWARANGCAT